MTSLAALNEKNPPLHSDSVIGLQRKGTYSIYDTLLYFLRQIKIIALQEE